MTQQASQTDNTLPNNRRRANTIELAQLNKLPTTTLVLALVVFVVAAFLKRRKPKQRRRRKKRKLRLSASLRQPQSFISATAC
ncbi:MAG: hypothetical protein P3M72_00145 [Candidatus Hodgkinia cicadicola]|nr:MAG: hypothetical protein P3M72_00145 [Candidatus Hodgkinia cicadicola]